MKNIEKRKDNKRKTMILVALTTMLVSYVLFIDITRINGASMENTLKDGEYHVAFKTNNVKRNDVIVFKTMNDVFYIKRVIGMPKDTIEFRGQDLYINGEKIEEPYIKDGVSDLYGVEGKLTLGSDEYFVMGDNREHSDDSRDFGKIKKEDIHSKLIFVE